MVATELDRIDLLHARYAADRVFKSRVRYLVETFRTCGHLVIPPAYYARDRDVVDLALYLLQKART